MTEQGKFGIAFAAVVTAWVILTTTMVGTIVWAIFKIVTHFAG